MSENKGLNLKYGSSSDCGRRPYQQDDYLIINNLFDLKDSYLFGVFDGHGDDGAKASQYIKKILPDFINKYKDNFIKDSKATLNQIYDEMADMLCENEEIDTYISGTTAVIAIFHDNKLIISNVGDSRVVIGIEDDNGNVIAKQMTVDHNCYNKEEYDRIIAKGGRVEALQFGEDSFGPLRIFKGSLPYPGLVVSRSLGDEVARRLGVISKPDISIIDIDDKLKFCVLATDGVWDGLSNEEVVEIVNANIDDPQKASEQVTQGSLDGMDKLQIDDNTTNVCVVLSH
ncbi:protein serine/threonine phosphatase 2C [Neocallimastix lanati (nom. inval.)]|jgi:serine/threonine protein phosphatase PrpC|uniref:Protein serine/threonine phosphatase 2C n=1 Tax=Neocallimastix californiae TaxID=1754190 RepID=A0A1Y1ZZF4_9FUNG|nr:protein serine/threonine phosphatase 2C [Neocallimastix sp. JGI-2020a]ORY15663.1 protein serine/threonine phosphatase 2C [Neocallimastix californiae]|eukprot:ORY15663.1 protein serine/threonine phosphatase 2C [Neocallimastix californiae]